MITAIVFVKADVARIPEVAEAIAALDGVSEVYSVTGQIDLIALVRVRDHDDVAAVVADRLNKVPGVHGDRDPHRLPGLLPARPRVGVLARSGLTPDLPPGSAKRSDPVSAAGHLRHRRRHQTTSPPLTLGRPSTGEVWRNVRARSRSARPGRSLLCAARADRDCPRPSGAARVRADRSDRPDARAAASRRPAIPVLTWDRLPDATAYDVQVSATPTFGTAAVDADEHRQPPGGARRSSCRPGDLYWRVERRTSAATGDWTTAAFDRSSVAAPGRDRARRRRSSWPATDRAAGALLGAGAGVDRLHGRDRPRRRLHRPDPHLHVDHQDARRWSLAEGCRSRATYYWRVRGQLAARASSPRGPTPRSYESCGPAKPGLVSPRSTTSAQRRGRGPRLEADARAQDLRRPGQHRQQLPARSSTSRTGITRHPLGRRRPPSTTTSTTGGCGRVDAAGNKLRLVDSAGLAVPARLARPTESSSTRPTARPSGTRSTSSGRRSSSPASTSCRSATNPSFTPAKHVVTCTTVHTTMYAAANASSRLHARCERHLLLAGDRARRARPACRRTRCWRRCAASSTTRRAPDPAPADRRSHRRPGPDDDLDADGPRHDVPRHGHEQRRPEPRPRAPRPRRRRTRRRRCCHRAPTGGRCRPSPRTAGSAPACCPFDQRTFTVRRTGRPRPPRDPSRSTGAARTTGSRPCGGPRSPTRRGTSYGSVATTPSPGPSSATSFVYPAGADRTSAIPRARVVRVVRRGLRRLGPARPRARATGRSPSAPCPGRSGLPHRDHRQRDHGRRRHHRRRLRGHPAVRVPEPAADTGADVEPERPGRLLQALPLSRQRDDEHRLGVPRAGLRHGLGTGAGARPTARPDPPTSGRSCRARARPCALPSGTPTTRSTSSATRSRRSGRPTAASSATTSR